MIKLIILDVDGVVKGFKEGINSPFPSKKVADYLRKTQDNGVPICLCTGKATFAMKKIIEMIGLDNQHITDGGAVLIDTIDNKILKSSTISPLVIKDLLEKTKTRKTLWELYTLDHKYVQAGLFPKELQESSQTMPWLEVNDLESITNSEEVIKAEVKYPPQMEEFYKNLFKAYESQIEVQWTSVPLLLPLKIFIITAKGVNKKFAVRDLINYYKVDPSEVLAVGDTLVDWQFMEGCGYVATLGNADDEMKKLVINRGGFIGGHVDDDGLIDVLEHYKVNIVAKVQLIEVGQ